MDGTEKSTKQKKYNDFYFFIFISMNPNGPKLDRQEHLRPH